MMEHVDLSWKVTVDLTALAVTWDSSWQLL